MSDTVINVESLGKRYRLQHLAARDRQFGYVTLRDVLAHKVRALFKGKTPNLEQRTSNVQLPNSKLQTPNPKPETPDTLPPSSFSPLPADEDFWALNEVSFEVRQGERVGIIGRNGAGKSTLLKILSRITEPTRGRVRLRGRVASLLEVGTGFHPELTGRENIYLNGAILGMGRHEIRRKFEEIVAFAEVERFLDTPVKRYSSGMYVRLAFAVAAHLEPEILIVDEVLAVGDAKFQRKCLEKMEDVGRQGRTVLFVSHNMAAVTRLCGRALLLDGGRVVLDGPAAQATAHYLNSGTSSAAQRVWPDPATAPGDADVRLAAVRVIDETTGQVCETLDIRHPIRIEIDYHNRANQRFAHAGLALYDGNGVCLFASGDYLKNEWRRQPRDFNGLVRSTCRIPGNFLAEGQHQVLVGLITYFPHEVIAMERDAVTFLVVDNTQGDGARGDHAGPFPGVIRPMLEWQVEHNSETLR